MNYHEEQKVDSIKKLRKLSYELPPFLAEYFRGIELNTAERTRLGYAHDLKIFFHYLVSEVPAFEGKAVGHLTADDLNKVTAGDIEGFLNYVSYYTADPDSDAEPQEYQNGEKGKARKLAAVRSMFKFFYKKQVVSADPAALVSTPKIHDKNIIRLDAGEIARLLDQVESGEKLSDRQQQYHKLTQLRDVALITTLLGTGMRISECVGLDIDDVDFDNNGLRIIRKGGNEAVVYFGGEVRKALLDYLAERKQQDTVKGHENALFLSMQKKRMSVRAIELLVDKYSKTITTLKHITPHKLRSTYGTALYNETGDIYLVADVLGHKDVNTTRKHYANMDENRRRAAANAVVLRDEELAAMKDVNPTVEIEHKKSSDEGK